MHKSVLIIVVLAAFAGAARASQPLVDAAGVALRAGNASNAAALATEALADTSISPRDRARVLVDRGLAREMLGERDAALTDFTDAINARVLPAVEQAKAYYDRGVVLDELGRTEDAAGDYTAALKLLPGFAAAYNNRGNAYRRLGKLAEAQADYRASIAAGNPHLEYPNFGLGQIAEASGQTDDARNFYRAALAANPQFALASDRLHAIGDTTQPVVLKPPGSDTVHLKPPPGTVVHLKPPHRAPPAAAPAAPPPEPDLKPALSDSGATTSIQLGAWRDEKDAVSAWNFITATGGNLLAGLTPQVVAADVAGKGRFYRLRAGPVERERAPGLCTALIQHGLACLVVKD